MKVTNTGQFPVSFHADGRVLRDSGTQGWRRFTWAQRSHLQRCKPLDMWRDLSACLYSLFLLRTPCPVLSSLSSSGQRPGLSLTALMLCCRGEVAPSPQSPLSISCSWVPRAPPEALGTLWACVANRGTLCGSEVVWCTVHSAITLLLVLN